MQRQHEHRERTKTLLQAMRLGMGLPSNTTSINVMRECVKFIRLTGTNYDMQANTPASATVETVQTVDGNIEDYCVTMKPSSTQVDLYDRLGHCCYK